MFVVVTFAALVTYGNYRFRAEAEVAIVVLASVTLDAIWASIAGRPRPGVLHRPDDPAGGGDAAALPREEVRV
jgi:hypothetical protein